VSGTDDNLGKTKGELDAKLGMKGDLVGFSTGLIHAIYPGADVINYHLDRWSVTATFLRESGTCEIIEYTKLRSAYGNSFALSDEEIKAMLEANSGGQAWKKKRGDWVRSDGSSAEECFNSFVQVDTFRITSAFAQRVFEQYKRDEAEKVKAATERF
jgi:hypothetical protein